MPDLDVNGPTLGELYDFPTRDRWPSIRAMMDVVWECKKMYAAGKSYDAVDQYWREEFEKVRND